MNMHWVALSGNAEIDKNSITFSPHSTLASVTLPGGRVPTPFCVLRSNVLFEQGTISLKVKVADSNARCQIALPLSAPNSAGQVPNYANQVYAGLNSIGTAYGYSIFRNGSWEAGDGTGDGTRVPVGEWIHLQLQIQGSNLMLYVNEVLVASAVLPLQKGPIDLLLQSVAPVEVADVKVDAAPPICFVVMQFTDEFNSLYKEVISPTCEAYGYKVVRADDFYTSGLIISDVTNSIKEASIVIADITPDNPNVFYEVGYAHAIDKPTILLSDRQRERLPFDVAGFRTLFYDNTIAGKSAVEERLRKHLDNIAA